MTKERLRPTGIVNTGNNVSGKGLRLGKRYTVAMGKTKKFITKKQIKHGAQFQKYAGPTVKLGRTVGAGVMGAGKLALRAGALGIPGAIATGLYYSGKHIIKKGEKVAKRSAFKTFDKKGRWML